MDFFKNPVGKKIIVALTGIVLVKFLFIHLLGNSTIFLGPDGINAYANGLHSLPPLVWGFRVLMLLVFGIHIYFAVKLTLENKKAKPIGYAVNTSVAATFNSKNMIWTGLIILAFVLYHLLHFTFQVTSPYFIASANLDDYGRPNLFKMVVLSFQKGSITLLYAVSLFALLLHLSHGIQSIFQSLGLNNDSLMPKIKVFGITLAVFLIIGYLSIPAAVQVGLIKI
jgi:succinate dehydrogenase / fumarate reductase cytochrome b subunit